MMAMRLLEPSAGRIVVDGTDISDMGTEALKPYRKSMQVIFRTAIRRSIR